MARRVEFAPYRPKTILNKQKHPDHWFWTRYSAYPYKGWQHRCLFCNCKEERVRQMERLALPPEKRSEAMERIAQAGILIGTCMMPILPGFCDDDSNLQS